MDHTEHLLQRCREGDAEARAELIAHSLPWLRQNLERRLGPRLKAACTIDDLVQDTVLRALEYVPKFTGDEVQFRGLLLRIGVNMAIDVARAHRAARRDARRAQPIPTTSQPGRDRPVETVTRPESNARRSEERALLLGAMRQLSEAHREVLQLHFQGLTDPEIAAKLGVSVDAAESRRRRAMESLAAQTLRQRPATD